MSDVQKPTLCDSHAPCAGNLIRLLVHAALLGMLATVWLPAQTYAQGGPPLLTDDPDTPGPGFWEVNLAVLIDQTSGRRRVELPRMDLDYGVGRRLQLNTMMTYTAKRRRAHEHARWLPLMYYRSAINGEGKLDVLMNDRYSSIRPTTTREYGQQEGL